MWMEAPPEGRLHGGPLPPAVLVRLDVFTAILPQLATDAGRGLIFKCQYLDRYCQHPLQGTQLTCRIGFSEVNI